MLNLVFYVLQEFIFFFYKKTNLEPLIMLARSKPLPHASLVDGKPAFPGFGVDLERGTV